MICMPVLDPNLPEEQDPDLFIALGSGSVHNAVKQRLSAVQILPYFAASKDTVQMSSSDTYKKLCEDAIQVVRQAAEYVRDRHEHRKDLHVEKKGRQNFVTEVDKKAEQILVEGLSRVLPEAGFIAEEGTEERRGDTYNWVIDPVDGTTNFIHGLFPFAISVALTEKVADESPTATAGTNNIESRPASAPAKTYDMVDGHHEVVAGVVYEFGLDELFSAWKGGGAWLNGERIRVSGTPDVGQSLIATGFPYTNFTYLDQFMESMDYFMKNSNGLRRLGSAATDIAYVACGRFDAFYEYGLHPWDLAAGLLLVTEAGGKVSDFNGNGDALFGQDFVCANGMLFEAFQATIRKIMTA